MGYIDGLSSGTSVDTQDFSLFFLSLGMTPKGMANAGEVLDLCFQWIAMIRSLVTNDDKTGNDLLHDYHTELTQLSRKSFQFWENGDPTSFVSSVVDMLYLYENEPGEILRGDSLTAIPGLNQFIATDFSSRCDDDKPTSMAVSRPPAQKTEGAIESTPPSPPQKILETAVLRLWHKMDSKFRVPKTTFNAHILTPNVYRSPRSMTACRLFQKVLNDDLNSFVYDATVAGNSYR